MNKTNKKGKKGSTESNETASNETATEEAEAPKVEKVQRKRSIPYPMNRVDKVFYGPASLTKEQLQ